MDLTGSDGDAALSHAQVIAPAMRAFFTMRAAVVPMAAASPG